MYGWRIGAVIFGIIVLILGGAMGGCAAIQHSSARTVTFTVQDKIVKGAKGKYLVFTNKGAFEDVDALFFGKFNSSDVYAGLHTGTAYKCRVFGWRIHPLSWYPNIVSCTPA